MTAGFPPVPVFPIALDSDETLFLVFNTSEAAITVDNQPWSDEIDITPVGDTETEQWGENGFANISGELFYYDDVGKNAGGKINKLKRIARNLGGKQTQFNKIGIMVRGFVVAEHHNQIVDSILKTEDFVGENFSVDKTTLDFRIRCLQLEPVCNDDHNCPDISFQFEIDEDASNNCEGTVVLFNVGIIGNFNSYRLDFGDGNFTTSDQIGTHTYAPSTKIDPVVTVINDNCEIIQTPVSRDNPEEPTPEIIPDVFEIPIPEVPEFPTILIPDCDIPETTLTFPPLIQPCIDLGPIGPIAINIPSIIIIEPPIPSEITFGPVDIPTIISFENPEFPTVSFEDPPGFVPISFVDPPSFTPIQFGPAPTVTVDWTPVPTITVECPATPVMAMSQGISDLEMLEDEDFIDGFENLDSVIKIEAETLGIPSKITVIAPDIPSKIEIEHSIPDKILLEIPDIKFVGLESIPSEIKLISETTIPKTIMLDASAIPNFIKIEIPDDFPRTIMLDASAIPTEIKVTGIPETIELIGNIPTEIPLTIPENAEIPLVYKGGPVPLTFSPEIMEGLDDDTPCFALVPCPK